MAVTVVILTREAGLGVSAAGQMTAVAVEQRCAAG